MRAIILFQRNLQAVKLNWIVSKDLLNTKGQTLGSPLQFLSQYFLHTYDKRVAAEPTVDAISDLETLGGSLTPKRVSRDPPFRSRRAVSFKCVSLKAQRVRYSDFGNLQRTSLGKRIRRKVDPHPQGRSSPQ